MEEVRYSKRIRAARSSAAEREKKSKAPLESPAYHPGLGIVMTPEQQDTLKRQITVFATICQQLVELHKASVAGGVKDFNGNSSGQREPTPTVLKAAPRHRWAPSQSQVEILERMYDGATPNKKRVKEITEKLSVLGPVTETNVYNWFQNRKAKVRRSKQRLRDVDSEGDGEHREKKTPEPRSDGEEHSRFIYISGDLREVPAGVFSVAERFGDGASLVDEREEIVQTDDRGFILRPLQSGGSYRLRE